VIKSLAVAIVVAGITLPSPIVAQQPATPFNRTVLQKVEVPGSTNMEAVTGLAEIMPNVNIGRHTHVGVETGYVIEGTLTLLVDGKPPIALKQGDSYQVPVNAIHDAKSGDTGAKVLAVYIVEKGKPLASPAP
jgi:quercetin dioxygenase-like cupin family protein